jgi:ribosomal protein S4
VSELDPQKPYHFQKCSIDSIPTAVEIQSRRSGIPRRLYQQKIFKRWYLPETLPDVRPRRKVLGDDKASLEEFALRNKKEQDLVAEEEAKGLAPVGSLMFAEVERRIDVFLFRCCFVHSVYEARRLVIHGNVMLNGKKVRRY